MQSRHGWITRANALTGVRFAAAPALVIALRSDAAIAAGALFALAVASDVADGRVARRFREQSGFGRLLDHAADAVFVTAGTATLAHAGLLPALLPTLIAAAFLQYAVDARSARTAGPRGSRLGRWNGIAYYAIVAIPIARNALAIDWPDPALIMALGWLLVGSTLLSMLDRLRASWLRSAGRCPRSSAID